MVKLKANWSDEMNVIVYVHEVPLLGRRYWVHSGHREQDWRREMVPQPSSSKRVLT